MVSTRIAAILCSLVASALAHTTLQSFDLLQGSAQQGAAWLPADLASGVAVATAALPSGGAFGSVGGRRLLLRVPKQTISTGQDQPSGGVSSPSAAASATRPATPQPPTPPAPREPMLQVPLGSMTVSVPVTTAVSAEPSLPAVAPANNDTLTTLPGSTCPDARALLDRTNLYRSRHHAPRLTWDAQLAANATAYAQRLADQGACGRRGSLAASRESGVGENLFAVEEQSRPTDECVAAVDSWYGESAYYNFETSRPYRHNAHLTVNHFTQLVWGSTSTVGCGMAVSTARSSRSSAAAGSSIRAGGSCVVVVCRYQEPGNVPDDRITAENVLRPLP